MSELSLGRIERIDRALMSRRQKFSRQREATPTQKLDALILFVVFSGAALILGTLLLVNAGWSPGNQQQIANEYRALRHNATTVAVEEWK